MSQITSGIRSILNHPRVYDAIQNIMGAQTIRRDLVSNFIRPTPGCRILDIGCGTAEILPFLPQGVGYWGYDISQKYIDAAKKRFGDLGYFRCGLLDQKELEKLPTFDIVIAIGVLHHLDESEAAELFRLARHALGKHGRLITIDPCLTPRQNPVARFLILHDRGQNVRTQEGYQDLSARFFSRVNGKLRVRRWIPYTHWIMECAV